MTAATLSYAANCALGAGVAAQVIDTSRVRWVHHALYIATATLTGTAICSGVRSGHWAGWALAPAALPLALIPYVSTRSRRHPALALAAAPFYLAGLTRAWR